VGFRRGMRPAGSITAGRMPMKQYKIAVLDDYQNVAVESADSLLIRIQHNPALAASPVPPAWPC
jgi:hypothetical protein